MNKIESKRESKSRIVKDISYVQLYIVYYTYMNRNIKKLINIA